jgi:predicted DNA-binding transcriptional regulator AlpA
MTTINNFVNSFIEINNISKVYFAKLGEFMNTALRAGRALTQTYANKLILFIEVLKALTALSKQMQGIAVIRFGYDFIPYPFIFRRREEAYPSVFEESNISFLFNVTFVEQEISEMIRGLEERIGEFRFMPSEGSVRTVQRFTPLATTRAILPSSISQGFVQYVPPTFFSYPNTEALKVSSPLIQEYVKLPQPTYKVMHRYVREVPNMIKKFRISDQTKDALETISRRYKLSLLPTISKVRYLPAFIESKIEFDLVRLETSLSRIFTTSLWRLTFVGIPKISSVYNIISSTTSGLTYPSYGILQAPRSRNIALTIFVSQTGEIYAFAKYPSLSREIVRVYNMVDKLREILENHAISLPTLYALMAAEMRTLTSLPELGPLMGIVRPMIYRYPSIEIVPSAIGITSQMVTRAIGMLRIYQTLTLSLSSTLGIGIIARLKESTRYISPLTTWISSAPAFAALRIQRVISETTLKAIPKPTLRETVTTPSQYSPMVQEEKIPIYEETRPWAIPTQVLDALSVAMSLGQIAIGVQRMIFAKGMVEAFDLSKIYRMEETEIAPFVGLLTKLGEDRISIGKLAFEGISKIPSSIQIITPPIIAPTYQLISTPKASPTSRITQIQPSMIEPSLIKEQVRTIQNTFNITIQAASLGDERDLRELRRKIEQILAEEARRYFGSTLM